MKFLSFEKYIFESEKIKIDKVLREYTSVRIVSPRARQLRRETLAVLMDSVTKDRMDFACQLMKDYPGAAYYMIAVSSDDIEETTEYAKELWPDATVKSTIVDHRAGEDEGMIQVYFNQENE